MGWKVTGRRIKNVDILEQHMFDYDFKMLVISVLAIERQNK